MRALIVNAYSFRNAGDAAIMLCTAELLRDLGIDEVLLSTRYESDHNLYAEWGVTVVPPLIAFPTEGASSRRTLVFAQSVLENLVGRPLARRVASLTGRARAEPGRLPSADLVVIAGGGYFYSSKRRLNLSYLHSALTVVAGKHLSPRVIMMPASIGKITKRFDRLVLEFALRGVEIVMRETVSMRNSTRPPRFRSGQTVIPDIAFYGAARLRSGTGGGQLQTPTDSRPIARVVVMDWRWSRSVAAEAFDQYLVTMAQICDRLAAAGYRVVLGGHSRLAEHGQDDIETCRSVQSLTSSADLAIDENCDVGHLWAEYERATVIVGTRLHACIMAASVGTPFVGLGYQEKTAGVIESFGGDASYFLVDKLDADVVVAEAMRAAALREHFEERAAEVRREIAQYYSGALLGMSAVSS